MSNRLSYSVLALLIFMIHPLQGAILMSISWVIIPAKNAIVVGTSLDSSP